MDVDLEDGEIEDGEIPDEEIMSGGEMIVSNEPEGSSAQPDSGPRLLHVQNDTTVSEEKHEISSSKLKRQVANRTGSAINHRHVGFLKESTVEDDWAGDVEKAIKAAMNSTDGGQELNAEINASGGITVKTEDDDRKSRRKKRKKKHREDDDDRTEAKVN
jgi:hypothetical protein